jgi:uncharacterized protein YcfJ
MIGRLLCAAAVLTFVSGEALASRDSYCRAYARDVANGKSGGENILGGALGGAATGAVVGGIIDGGEGAGKGAIIGGVGGTLLGAALTGSTKKKAYKKAYRACMNHYARLDEEEGYERPVRYRKPRRDSAEWDAYCADRYASYDPDTGMYRSYSGRWKPCQ